MPFVDNAGIKIHYVVEGQGTPIVLIHASMGSHKEWYWPGFVSELKDEYMLILPDLRGHGESDYPHDPSQYSTMDFTSDIIAILDDLKIPKAHCWGYSMGGTIAFWLSKYYPERFLTFIIGGAYPQKYTGDALKRHLHVKNMILSHGADGLIAYVKERGDNLTSEGEKHLRSLDYDSIKAWLNSEDLYNRVDEHLPSLDIPFFLYAGEKDEWNTYPHLVEITNKMKNAEIVLFPDVGHDVHYRKGMVLPYVIKFLTKRKY
jgi:pimeloyl-ACP methyl ester carboxylesterase